MLPTRLLLVRRAPQLLSQLTARAYTSAPKDPTASETSKSTEPVDTAVPQSLESNHARFPGGPEISDKLSEQMYNNPKGSMALVPLSVIYLPPPHWHTPLRPLNGKTKQDAHIPMNSHANGTDDTEPLNTLLDGQNASDLDTGKNVDSQDTKEQATFGIRQLLGKLFSTRKQSSPSPAPSSQDEANSRSTDTVSRWQRESALFRLLVSGKAKLDSLRSLPKDDDWTTWVAKALNQTTGYDHISQLKQRVEETGTQFHQARRDLEVAKQKHAHAIHDRIASQREINSLLQRKHLWNEEDVARFTSLYRMEHQSESFEQTVAKQVHDAETLVDRRYDELVNSIRMRYHEEQIWSDKIRRASTYGTWAVLFMNIVALFLAQAIFEPRKRRKIVAGVDEKMAVALEEHQVKAADARRAVEQRMESHEKATRSIVDHLSTMSAVLGAVASRQEAEVSALSAQLLNGSAGGASVDPAAMVLGGDNGYSDTELDMYYEQQQRRQQQQQQQRLKEEKVYTKSQAQKIAAGVAAATGLIIGMATYCAVA
ncbi:sensitivity to high expression protein she9 [Coemansia sp. RSA 1813]|nr:sensitivity to high expression protein she9 [Coemansia sp. RSA 1843]KAJ2086519.1 sensitivity to high expression protein she9 [Coemansia sp. RSA 986]KAJ2212563.1 sensitivity to high expression protein she9 [Coemansia sp. RSA 487]KAJ2564720.1 sensitivity to high expression protein she9 [Coemansia sp. RSA 1813]